MRQIGLAVFLAVNLFAQAAPGNAIVTPPIETHTTTTVNLVAPPPDPKAIADASVESSGAVLNTVIAPAPVQWANSLAGLPDIWRTTPPNLTYGNSAIKDLASLIRNVALALIGLAILARGIAIVLGREEPTSLGRLFFAAIAAWSNLIFWQIGIDLNNAIAASIGAPDLPSLIKPHLVSQIDPASTAGVVILLLVYAIVALLLLFSLIFRLGLIDILIATGSLALICYATTQTEHIANHYTRIATAVLFGQVLIVVCLRCASVLATLGSGGVLGTLLSIVILWLARSAPQAILAGGAAGSSQGGQWGRVAFAFIRRRVGG